MSAARTATGAASTTVTTAGAPATTVAAPTITVAPGDDPRLPAHNFRLASGNVGCVAFADRGFNVVTCEARPRDWAPPPKPADCDWTWVAYAEVRATGHGGIGICTTNFLVGDPTSHRIPPPFTGLAVPDGSDVRVAAIVCHVRAGAIACRNPQGHGFLVSRTRAGGF